MTRIPILDGWRGLSILLVLIGHLFPVGPKGWALNGAAASSGMALFFTLSGFLICKLLLRNQNISRFLIRRFSRIIPIAWLTVTAIFLFSNVSVDWLMANLTFVGNIPPIRLSPLNAHFWSLCVEIQFYVFAALLVAVAGRSGLLVIPILLGSLTAYKFLVNPDITILTSSRIDEIFAGCCLGLLHEKLASQRERYEVPFWITVLLACGLVVSTWDYGGQANYLRPYFAAALVGSTLFLSDTSILKTILTHKALVYVAGISYALYVYHVPLMHSWLGEGDTFEKYMKRPLLLGALFLLAHLSTKYYEAYFIRKGRELSSRL